VSSNKACLLVTNLFPPALGGSSQVYAALAKHAAGGIAVLASSHDHETGLARPDWQALDRGADYPIYRVRCVRPFLRKGAGGFRYRLHEAATGLKLAVTVIGLAWRLGAKTICIADDETVGWLAWLARRVLRRRTLIYCHGDDLVRPDARRSRWFRLADRIVAANRHAARLLTERFAVPSEKIALVQNGVDLAVFRPAPPPALLLREYGLSERKVLVSVTRLVPRKGVDKVLEAIPSILTRFPDVTYLVAGDGPQRAELEETARRLGIASQVMFAGAVPHAKTADFYNIAELVLLPNREEGGEADGLPLVFLEANACGKAVIGGKAGGSAEVIRHGENGVLVDGGDSHQIGEMVCRLLADEGLRTAMGRKALQMAQSWGWEARSREFLQACGGA
jgi:phosphatidylinositol alpha-1,6-mannosyltransferase